MTLQEILSMDVASFQKACKDVSVNMSDPDPINTGEKSFEDALKSFDAFESTPESILAIHEAGRSCP
jgi:hypothetical protein